MKIKNRTKNSGFSARTYALAAAPTTFVIYTAPSKAVKVKKATADVRGLSRIDLAARVGTAMVKQGKHIVKGCRVVFDNADIMVIGFDSRPVWRDEMGRFCKDPAKA